jgi:CBS domain-containing protein
MATVNEIMAKKGPQVWTVGREATVLQAAQLMNEHRIGALVVLENDRIVGMFTERDVLRRVVGEQRQPATTPVAEVMTSKVACCTLRTLLEEARTAMKDLRIRHLPVVDEEGRLRGLLSIGDLNAFEAASQEQTIFWMKEYMHGRV